ACGRGGGGGRSPLGRDGRWRSGRAAGLLAAEGGLPVGARPAIAGAPGAERMSTSLADRTWNACFSALQLDRFLAKEMTEGEAERVRAHLGGCARCTAALDELRAGSEERLPPLRVVPLAPRSRVPFRVAAAVVGVAAAASLLLMVRPPAERTKGQTFSLSMYVDHQGAVRRALPGEIGAPGDAVRFAVSAPARAYLAALSLDPKGHGSIYFPTAGRAEAISAGEEIALPLGTRLDETVGEERILGLLCASPGERD